jgi:DNA-binding transcriptional MerR regulator
MNTKTNFLVASDWFDYNFLGGYLNKEHKSKEFLNTPKFKIGDEKISSRVLNHWHDTGLLNDNRIHKKSWRKFTFSEVVWINIIIKLRDFGMNIKKIKKVKECLEVYNTNNHHSKCELLDFYIAFCMSSKTPVKLLVFDSGEALLAKQSEIDLSTQFDRIKDDYISIDLGKLINSRFKGKKVETNYLNHSISTVAKEIENGIYLDDVNSISIKLSGDNDILVSKEYIRENIDEVEKLINKVGKFYEKSIVRNGKGKYYKVIEKRKIKR